MDIQYLLLLQNFRNGINDSLTPFMEWVSMFAVDYLILFAVFYYWCCDKRDGLYTLVSYYFCMVVTPLIKLTACVYRPWIRDSRILPAGDSIRTATGYSFPSGHTTTAAPIAGGMAVNTWKNRQTKPVAVVFALFIALTMFSRNYLGVHTPQDVCVGCILSLLSLFLTAKLFKYLEAHPEKENYLLTGGFVFCCLAIWYITCKPYPMDYVDGKLLVDPQKMMNDGYGDIGKMMGFILARFVEKTWIRFRALRKGVKSSLICLICLIPMVLMKEYVRPVLTDAFGPHWGKLFFSVIYTFYYIAFVPFLLKLLQGREEKAARSA
ncbi:MAG: phosphatase PAP2 family protein [Lachnospiraceae bacterium]|nr:phosphatase PAP2 family protein [Lachnospiraceae bacterium]